MNNTRNKNILDLILTSCSIISEVCISVPLGLSDVSSIGYKATWNSADSSKVKSRYPINRANFDAFKAKICDLK